MTAPTFRNPDKFQQLSFRDWFRKNKPSGKEGYVVEDLDLVLRIFGANFHTDATGKFILIELKFKNAWIGPAQKRTFSLINSLLRQGDPERKRYLGYYVVQYDNEDWDKASFRINRVKVTCEEFDKFSNLDSDFLSSLPTVLEGI